MSAITTSTRKTKVKFPAPTELNITEVTAKDVTEMRKVLDTYGVAVLPLQVTKGQRDEALNNTPFYNTANAIFTDDFKVPEPTLDEKLHPEKMKLRKVPESKSGMIQQYFTPIHWLIQSDPILRSALNELYHEITGTQAEGRMKFMINRLRVSQKYKFDDYSLHIEGKDLFEVGEDSKGIETITLKDGEIASIVGLTGHRRFAFWDMNGADLKPLYLYYLKNQREFTKIPPHFMHKHYAGRRRMITVDCTETPHLIVWKETAPHEIACSPSSSLFVSPISKYESKKITKVCTYQPEEYLGLTYHESNLLGALYNQGGFEWPSGKKLYQFCHQRAYKHWLPKVEDRYKKDRTEQGKDATFQMRLISGGTIDQHTKEYQDRLKARGIVLPAIAFDKDTPKFVIDILNVPDIILRDHGYIC
jgi:hypothetical protein